MDFVVVGVTALVPVCDGDGDCVLVFVFVGVTTLVGVRVFVFVGVTALVPVCV